MFPKLSKNLPEDWLVTHVSNSIKTHRCWLLPYFGSVPSDIDTPKILGQKFYVHIKRLSPRKDYYSEPAGFKKTGIILNLCGMHANTFCETLHANRAPKIQTALSTHTQNS